MPAGHVHASGHSWIVGLRVGFEPRKEAPSAEGPPGRGGIRPSGLAGGPTALEKGAATCTLDLLY